MRLVLQTHRDARACFSVLDKHRWNNLDRAMAESRISSKGKGGQRRVCQVGVETHLPLERGLGRQAHPSCSSGEHWTVEG